MKIRTALDSEKEKDSNHPFLKIKDFTPILT